MAMTLQVPGKTYDVGAAPRWYEHNNIDSDPRQGRISANAAGRRR
jgi:hypothetical protein